MPTPRYHILNNDEVDVLERTPFNPPQFTQDFTEEDFYEEWLSVRAGLRCRLEERWKESSLDEEGDFALSESCGRSRWIYVTFTSPSAWCREFTECIVTFLNALDEEYMIGCLTELEYEENPCDFRSVYLAIGRNMVQGQADTLVVQQDEDPIVIPSPEILRLFGFPEELTNSEQGGGGQPATRSESKCPS